MASIQRFGVIALCIYFYFLANHEVQADQFAFLANLTVVNVSMSENPYFELNGEFPNITLTVNDTSSNVQEFTRSVFLDEYYITSDGREFYLGAGQSLCTLYWSFNSGFKNQIDMKHRFLHNLLIPHNRDCPPKSGSYSLPMGLSTAFNISSLRNNKGLCNRTWFYRQTLRLGNRNQGDQKIYNVTAKVDMVIPYGLCEKENSTNNTGTGTTEANTKTTTESGPTTVTGSAGMEANQTQSGNTELDTTPTTESAPGSTTITGRAGTEANQSQSADTGGDTVNLVIVIVESPDERTNNSTYGEGCSRFTFSSNCFYYYIMKVIQIPINTVQFVGGALYNIIRFKASVLYNIIRFKVNVVTGAAGLIINSIGGVVNTVIGGVRGVYDATEGNGVSSTINGTNSLGNYVNNNTGNGTINAVRYNTTVFG